MKIQAPCSRTGCVSTPGRVKPALPAHQERLRDAARPLSPRPSSISAAVGSEAAFIQPDPSVTNPLSFEICAGSLWCLGASMGNRFRNFFHHQHPCVGGEKDFLFNSQCLLHRFVCKTGRERNFQGICPVLPHLSKVRVVARDPLGHPLS